MHNEPLAIRDRHASGNSDARAGMRRAGLAEQRRGDSPRAACDALGARLSEPADHTRPADAADRLVAAVVLAGQSSGRRLAVGSARSARRGRDGRDEALRRRRHHRPRRLGGDHRERRDGPDQRLPRCEQGPHPRQPGGRNSDATGQAATERDDRNQVDLAGCEENYPFRELAAHRGAAWESIRGR